MIDEECNYVNNNLACRSYSLGNRGSNASLDTVSKDAWVSPRESHIRRFDRKVNAANLFGGSEISCCNFSQKLAILLLLARECQGWHGWKQYERNEKWKNRPCPCENLVISCTWAIALIYQAWKVTGKRFICWKTWYECVRKNSQHNGPRFPIREAISSCISSDAECGSLCTRGPQKILCVKFFNEFF